MKTLTDTSATLAALRAKVCKKLPKINVEDDAYCIGYWASEAHMLKPDDIDDPRFAEGWAQSIADRKGGR